MPQSPKGTKLHKIKLIISLSCDWDESIQKYSFRKPCLYSVRTKTSKMRKTVIASGGKEPLPVQFALLERSNPLTFQEIASAKNASQ
ncbi:hypothetical protein A2V82_06795 [candidate division KSB1 bacterium RBG_16_48_16]|nr:MAG: hypothetical protein A2V82_06795 [candidate division KSB1 bacterium RBG_16_48_16]